MEYLRFLVQFQITFLIAMGILRFDDSLLGKVMGIEDELESKILVIFAGPIPKGCD